MSSKQSLAQAIYDEGRIVNGDKTDTYIVNSESGSSYNVKLVTDPMYNYEYYCTCPAWKFDTSRECKHVLAIKLLVQNNNSNYRVRTNKPQVGATTPTKSTGWFDQKSKSQFRVRGNTK